MAALRRSSLGTRLFLSLATMLVPLALVGVGGLASHYHHTEVIAGIEREAVDELASVSRARDAVAEGDASAIRTSFAALPEHFDNRHEHALVGDARRVQTRGAPPDQVQRALARVRQQVLANLASASERTRSSANRQLVVLVLLLLAGAGIAVTLARRLHRDITRPLHELHAAAHRVAQDDFGTPVRIHTHDELEHVGAAFNTMMDRLRDSRGALVHQAFHDPLTGLPNRALFQDRTEQSLTRAHRGRGSVGRVAVLFLDLDDFKGVNDGFGHSAGDELLTTVATRLRDTLRTEDTIARLGGDEFAILLEQVPDAEHAEQAADRLLDALTPGTGEHLTDASIGIALSTGPEDTAEELLRNADVAMYAAKAAGRGRRETFAPHMHNEVFTRMSMERDLRRGLERDEFRLVYQPVLDLQSGRTVAVEALLRWDHPERGAVSPVDFIPHAERCGLIVPLGRWVLEQATAQAAKLQALPGADPELTMAVNLSPRQLQDRHLVADVARCLDASGIAPGTLVLELTESLLLTDLDQTVEVLAALKRLGVLLAIDDIGTGYSSLSYLRRFPIDVLKLDRELVCGSEQDATLTRALLTLGRELNLATVAEGIEHPEQLAELKRLGCDLGQGFLFARPMPADELAETLGGAPVGA